MKVLVTGGSGFIGAHIVNSLLENGHSVVTTVRSEEKASKLRETHPGTPVSKLDFRIVEDIALEGAFDKAVKSIDGLDAVIHSSSPFHFNVTDTKKDLLDPAIIGTTNILKAIKLYAPSVKHVVITSSFASILDASKGVSIPDKTYSEADWNPTTLEKALEDPSSGYRASKTFAEKAAWDFVATEKPTFALSTMCPPLVLGPIIHPLDDIAALNTSNQRVRNLIQGKCKEEIPDTGVYLWVDVRDLALAHVRALERGGAQGKRFFVTAGHFSNKLICEVIRKNFPEYGGVLPGREVKGGDFPAGGVYQFDNSRTREVLGIEFRGLEESIVDLVGSLKRFEL